MKYNQRHNIPTRTQPPANRSKISDDLFALVKDEDKFLQSKLYTKELHNHPRFFQCRCPWCKNSGEFTNENIDRGLKEYLDHVKICKIKNSDADHIFCPFCPKYDLGILRLNDEYVSEGFTDEHVKKTHLGLYTFFMEEMKQKKSEKPKKITNPKLDDSPQKEASPKKRSVPLALKRKVWAKHIGEDIGKAKCTCCKLSDISQMSFHCGHIVAHENGGKNTLLNLKPICQSCNSSMGTKDMDQFINECGL